MAREHQNSNGSFKQNQNWRGSLRHLTLKVTLKQSENNKDKHRAQVAVSSRLRLFTLKLEMDELFAASFNVSFTQLTIMSSLTFCPPPISSRIFNVYLNKIKNDFWKKVAKEFDNTESSQGTNVLFFLGMPQKIAWTPLHLQGKNKIKTTLFPFRHNLKCSFVVIIMRCRANASF